MGYMENGVGKHHKHKKRVKVVVVGANSLRERIISGLTVGITCLMIGMVIR